MAVTKNLLYQTKWAVHDISQWMLPMGWLSDVIHKIGMDHWTFQITALRGGRKSQKLHFQIFVIEYPLQEKF